jgi:hypothetical protein
MGDLIDHTAVDRSLENAGQAVPSWSVRRTSDRVNELRSPLLPGAVRGAPLSGTHRCSTWPTDHPEHHRCSAACRTAHRYRGGR